MRVALANYCPQGGSDCRWYLIDGSDLSYFAYKVEPGPATCKLDRGPELNTSEHSGLSNLTWTHWITNCWIYYPLQRETREDL
jgi:hypothetical protein